MYQINRRSASVNFSENEISDVNANLQAIQDKHGVVFSTFKELILHLISVDLAENPEITKTEMPENAVILTENQKIIELNPVIETEIAENPEITISELFTKSIENSKKAPEIKEISVEKKLTENEMILEISPLQQQILVKIGENRRKLKVEKQTDPAPIVAMKMIFNKSTLFNWGGEFETGLKLSDFEK